MDQTVLVTGGAAGVGRAVAERFRSDGARVHVCDVDAEAVAELAESSSGLRGGVADVGDPTAVEALFREAREWLGRIDVLINNVGIAGPRAPVEELSYEEWDRTIRVNLSGMFYCMKQVLPAMKRRGRGVIVNISSGSARTLPANRSVYNVSKAGVEGLTRTVAREVGPSGVRVNAIRPGAVNNRRMHRVLERVARDSGRTPEELKQDFVRFVSMRTLIEPVEIAELAVFLASDAARHITAQVIAVDGNVEWEE